MNHAMLYVTEWTAADGSKRRPLIERVPECRPVETERDWPLVYKTGVIGFRSCGFGWDSRDSIAHMISDQCAVALLRCACEDWLCQQWVVTLNNAGSLTIEDPDSVCSWHDFAGDSIHHALVDAAHKIADVKGITP